MQTEPPPDMPTEKPCVKCKEVKPLTAFAPAPKMKLGVRSWCRQCVNARQNALNAERRVKNPEGESALRAAEYERQREKRIAAAKAYYETHREKRKEQMLAYNEAHREELREADRQYRAEHREERAIHNRKWRKDNPDRSRDAFHRKKARRLGCTVVEYVSMTVLYHRDGGICQLCHEPVGWDVPYWDPLSKTIDHIVPFKAGGEHSYANTRLAHLSCNERDGAEAHHETQRTVAHLERWIGSR